MAKIVSDFYNHPKNQNPQKGLTTHSINEIVSSFLNKQKLSKGKRFHTSLKMKEGGKVFLNNCMNTSMHLQINILI